MCWVLIAVGTGIALGAGFLHPAHPPVVRADVTRPREAPAGFPVAKSGALDPAGFAPGACVAFDPTDGDRHETVFLDAGHGGPDPGALGGTGPDQSINEKDLTLPVALAAAQQLRASGYRVVLSRTTDTAVGQLAADDISDTVLTTSAEHRQLLARVRCANLAQAAALVSIHFDAYSDPSAAGATTLYDPDRSFAAANETLATLLQHNIITALAAGGWQVADRGIVSDTTAGGGELTPEGTAYGHVDILGPAEEGYVDQPAAMPGALIEPLFITNPTESGIAASPDGQQAIAQGIAQAVTQFLR